MGIEKEIWFNYLENRSHPNGFYHLVYNGVPDDWQPHQNFDFVVLRTSAFSGDRFPKGNISKTFPREEYCFPESDYVVLDKELLGVYMSIADKMTTITDAKGRNFIELIYYPPEPLPTARAKWDEYLDEYEERRGENIDPREVALIEAYELLKTGTDKERALACAKKWGDFLSNRRVDLSGDLDFDLNEIWHVAIGYNIVATVYAWNDDFDNAAIVDSYYIKYPNIWDILGEHISAYLTMLMAKKQKQYLEYLFRDPAFKESFLPHFEAYYSLLVDGNYPLTRMMEVVPIINSVNNFPKYYL